MIRTDLTMLVDQAGFFGHDGADRHAVSLLLVLQSAAQLTPSPTARISR
jgi:hypothetical protein